MSDKRMENRGILYVFPVFHSAWLAKKIRCPAADDLFRDSLKLSRQYEKEQAEIAQLAAVLEREIETQAGQVSDVNEFLKLVDKYLDIPELDAAILNELVSRIVVHSPVRENGRKQVQIDLYFTYVGQIRIPLKIGRESLNESEPA